MNHFKPINQKFLYEFNRPLKVFVVNSTTNSVKNKKLFERSEFFLFSYEDLNFEKVSEGLIFCFVLHQGKMKRTQKKPKN